MGSVLFDRIQPKVEKRDHRPHVHERRGGKWREEEKKGDHERLRV